MRRWNGSHRPFLCSFSRPVPYTAQKGGGTGDHGIRLERNGAAQHFRGPAHRPRRCSDIRRHGRSPGGGGAGHLHGWEPVPLVRGRTADGAWGCHLPSVPAAGTGHQSSFPFLQAEHCPCGGPQRKHHRQSSGPWQRRHAHGDPGCQAAKGTGNGPGGRRAVPPDRAEHRLHPDSARHRGSPSLRPGLRHPPDILPAVWVTSLLSAGLGISAAGLLGKVWRS